MFFPFCTRKQTTHQQQHISCALHGRMHQMWKMDVPNVLACATAQIGDRHNGSMTSLSSSSSSSLLSSKPIIAKGDMTAWLMMSSLIIVRSAMASNTAFVGDTVAVL